LGLLLLGKLLHESCAGGLLVEARIEPGVALELLNSVALVSVIGKESEDEVLEVG